MTKAVGQASRCPGGDSNQRRHQYRSKSYRFTARSDLYARVFWISQYFLPHNLWLCHTFLMAYNAFKIQGWKFKSSCTSFPNCRRRWCSLASKWLWIPFTDGESSTFLYAVHSPWLTYILTYLYCFWVPTAFFTTIILFAKNAFRRLCKQNNHGNKDSWYYITTYVV